MEKTIEIQLAEHGERIAEAIENELDSNSSYFGLATIGEKWYGYQDALRLAVRVARTTK